MGACAVHRRSQAIVEFPPIDEAGERIVARLIMQRAMQAALLADVVEHHHRADQIAGAVANRRRRILDGDLLAAAGHRHGMFRQPEGLAVAQAAHHRTLRRQARGLVHDREHVADALRLRLAILPTREALGNGIHESMRPSESVVITASPMDCSVTWARSLA
jgi:hypothetical protein